ncbi:P12 family lipoprotein [Borreliella valaisiana]|uniref:P12 family lipoprotein n=1 Tax=Borreliella valaisiana TaxID=62088 RepID=UPI003B2255CC
MKGNIVSVFMLTILFLLLSCDFEAIKPINKANAKSKLSDENKNLENLNYVQEDQKICKDGEELADSIKNLKSESKITQVLQKKNPDVPFLGMAIDKTSMITNSYFIDSKVMIEEIEEKDLIPSTEAEKLADSGIKRVENELNPSNFVQLIKDACDLKDRFQKISYELYNLVGEIRAKKKLLVASSLALSSFNSKKGLDNSIKTKIRYLNQWDTQLKVFGDLEKINNNIDVAIGEIKSAESFFNKAKESLNEAITKRLENEKLTGVMALRRTDVRLLVNLSKDALSYAENALEQVSSSSLRVGESISIMKDIEKLIEDAKFNLQYLL